MLEDPAKSQRQEAPIDVAPAGQVLIELGQALVLGQIAERGHACLRKTADRDALI